MAKILVEASVETLEEAIAAERAGVDRVELCADLADEGLTPASALIASVVERLRIPVFAIVRPRGGGFVYSDEELERMRLDILTAAASGLSGVVTGALSADGTIDVVRVRALVAAAGSLPVTFHRAFDRVADQRRALETVIDAGIRRVLTSGGAATALEGAPAIQALVQQAGERISIVAAGTVRAHNAGALVARTGVREVHSRFVDAAKMRRLVATVTLL